MIKNTEIRVEEQICITEEKPKFNVFQAMLNFVKNRPAVGATLAAMGMFIGMQGAATAVQVVFQRYFQNAQISGIVQMFSMIPIVAFTPLARKMVTKYGKKELSAIGALCSIVVAAGLFIIVPTNTGLDLILYIVCQLVYSLGLGIYSTVSWAMMGDAIDYNEWKTGKREEGTVYSLHSFFRKLAQGIGPAVALIIMTSLGYVNNAVLINGNYVRPEIAGQVASAINPAWLDFSVAVNLRILVAVLFLVSALFQFIGLVLVYNLDKKTLDKMQAELAERSKLKTEPVFAEEQVEGTDESQQE
jgi:GPH family glycoside/pentoside/hexuronide:cation symporter